MAERGRPAGKLKHPKKIRKHFYMTERMAEKVEKIAIETGVPQAYVLRNAIQHYIDNFDFSSL